MVKTKTIELSLSVISKPASTACDVVGVFQDSSKKPLPVKGPYSPVLERLKKTRSFSGSSGSICFLRFCGKDKTDNLLLLGLGQASELTEEKLRAAGGHLWTKIHAEKLASVCVSATSFSSGKGLPSHLSPEKTLSLIAEGVMLASYSFDKYKPSKKDFHRPEQVKIHFLLENRAQGQAMEKEFGFLKSLRKAIHIARDWSNEPSNVGTPEFYAAESRKLAREYGLKCRILSERDAEREKMGLFLGVGAGSEREGKIVILEYIPRGIRKPKTLAFVGKGITFDSGGISIKPAAKMEEMKHDMTGAATVLGATLLASALKAPNRILCILAFTENMPSGSALQPGSILRARSGKTVEIINTDAEGRLILADALDYIQDFKPDAIIDAATLTGAIGVALGRYTCGIFGNNDEFLDKLKRASELCGERVWVMPLYDEYLDDIKSEVADMKNSGSDPYGGAAKGAVFLKQYIRKNTPWIHMDIAYTATNLSHLPYFPKKGASGAHVRSLARLAMDY